MDYYIGKCESMLTSGKNMGYGCMAELQNGKRCKLHRHRPIIKYVIPKELGYNKLKYTKQEWKYLLWIRKQIKMPKFLWYKILMQTIPVYKLLKVGQPICIEDEVYNVNHIDVGGKIVSITNRRNAPMVWEWDNKLMKYYPINMTMIAKYKMKNKKVIKTLKYKGYKWNDKIMDELNYFKDTIEF